MAGNFQVAKSQKKKKNIHPYISRILQISFT